MKTALTAAALAVIGAGILPAAGAARPCGEHVGKDRQACLKQYKRDKMDWPPNPTVAEADKGRKASFCARMGGVVAKSKNAERAKASMRRWKC